MRQQYEAILPYCDLVFGSQRDLTELLGLTIQSELPEAQQVPELIQRFMKTYDLTWFAGTTRQVNNGKKYLAGFVYSQTESVLAEAREIDLLDRIGAGDAYAAGILLGYSQKWSLSKTVEFATVNGILAHTIQGDVPLTTIKQVEHVLAQPLNDLIR